MAATATPTQTPTARSHFAAMRRYEDAARSLSVQLSVRGFIGGFAGEISADEIAAMKAQRDGLYLAAAAYRRAAYRLERPQRIRSRAERVLRPAVRIVLHVRRAVTA